MPTKLLDISTSLQGSKNYLRIIHLRPSNPANLVKIGPVDFEVTGLTKIVNNKETDTQISPPSAPAAQQPGRLINICLLLLLKL